MDVRNPRTPLLIPWSTTTAATCTTIRRTSPMPMIITITTGITTITVTGAIITITIPMATGTTTITTEKR